jgi:competence protein ComEC
VASGPTIAVFVIAGAAFAVVADVTMTGAVGWAVAALSLRLLVDRPRVSAACLLVAAGAASAAHAAWARDRALRPDVDDVLWAVVSSATDPPGNAGVARAAPRARPLPSSAGQPPTAATAVPPPQTMAVRTVDTVELVRVSGRLLADARPSSSGGALLLIDVHTVEDARGVRPARLRVQAHVGGAHTPRYLEAWTRGRTVDAPITLRAPQVLRNPGGATPRWQALVRGFHAAGSIKSAWLVTAAPGAWWDESAAAVRRYVRRAAATLLSPVDPQAAAVVVAILIGDRAGLDPEVEERLQRAGTYHVIAISGGNVAMLCAMFLIVLRPLRSRRLTSITCMGLIGLYGWMVGGEPSVTRAVTAACVYLACDAAGLIAPPARILAVVGLIVSAWDPLAVVMPGAWLSFGATAGILLWASRLTTAIPIQGGSSVLHRAGAPAVALVCATLAAEVVLLPISLLLFARAGVAGLVLNFIAIPAMAVVQFAGLGAVLVLPLWPGFAVVAARVAGGAATLLVESSRLVEVWPWLSRDVPPPTVAIVATFYLATAWLWWAWSHPRGRAAASCACGVLLLAMITSPGLSRRRPQPSWVRLTMIDVGQGEAMLLQTREHAVLIDTGASTATFDAGRRTVAPALWSLGVRRLDYLIITHPDLDHIGGAGTLAHIFAPREIWEGVPVSRDPERRALREIAAARAIGWRAVQRGDRLELGSVLIEVLHPPLPDWERPRVRNDDSVVVRVRYGEADLLLTGDIGAAAEQELTPDVGAGRLRLLKVAHHGSRTSSSDAIVERYAPVVAMVSAGARNTFGHPAPEVVRRLADAGATLFRTDRHGALIVETDGRELRVQTWSGLRWRAGLAPNAPQPP